MAYNKDTDMAYIIQHVVSDYDLDQAMKLHDTQEQVEYLRRAIVNAAPMGYCVPGPFYFTGQGVVKLTDTLAPESNLRKYKIVDIVKTAIARRMLQVAVSK